MTVLTRLRKRQPTSFYDSDTGVTSNSEGSFTYQTEGSVSYGDNIPDWKGRIARGENATTSLIGVHESVGKISGSYSVSHSEFTPFEAGFPLKRYTRTVGSGYAWQPSILLGGVPADLSATKSEALALAKFNEKTWSEVRSFQGGVFLGELRKTLHSIKNPAMALKSGLEAYNRRAMKLRGAVRKGHITYRDLLRDKNTAAVRTANRAVAGLWLEGVYHWQPLLHDIDDAMEAMQRFTLNPNFRMVKATYTDREIVSQQRQGGSFGPLNYINTVTVRSEVSTTYRGIIDCKPQDPAQPNRDLWGFNPRDFVPTVWELLPYSFLIDYFTNVGDVIAGWSYGGVGVRWASITTRRCYTTIDAQSGTTISPDSDFNKYIGTVSQRPTESVQKHVHRRTYTGNFVPEVRWELPTSPKKLVNMAALLVSKLA